MSSFPALPPNTPGFPANPVPLTFDGFAGLNTKPTRPGIGDQDMYICDGFMPLGRNNLRTLYDVGDAIYLQTDPALSISFYAFANIGDTPYCFVFISDGSIVRVNTLTGIGNVIAGAGTISVPSNAIAVAQWGSQYVLIIAPQTDGYFIYDGTLFYKAGTTGPQPSIQSGGFGYTSAPSVIPWGGAGAGATFTSTAQNDTVIQITVTSQGSGYAATDFVFLGFSGGGQSATTALPLATVAAGTVASVSISYAGTGYTSTSVVQFLGGGGFGATGLAVVSAGTVASVSIINSGHAYTTAPTVYVTDANNPVAQATLDIMPFGIQGTTIETFQSRVWIGNGAAPNSPPPKSRIVFTGPGTPTNFSPGIGGGSFLSTDSFLKVGFHSLKQSNGFLYLIGDSSINYISGVTSSGSPIITTFQNQNVDPQIGSPWQNTVQVFSRNIVLANTFGVHASYGGAVTKVSDALDGIYTSVEPTGSVPDYGGLQPSAAVAIVFGIHVYMLLLPIIDQVTGVQTNKLLMWDGKRWWTASQTIDLTFIATQEINSVLTAFGTDGRAIYPLFQTPNDLLTKTAQSKLWDNPGIYLTKVARRLYGVTFFFSPLGEALTITIDNGITSMTTAQSITPGTLTWINNSGQTITWTNNAMQPLVWTLSGVGVFGPIAVSEPGALIGLTLQTQAADMALIMLTLLEQAWQTDI